MKFSSLLLSETLSTPAVVVLAVIASLLVIFLAVLIWWVEIKKRPFADLFKTFWKNVYGAFDRFNDVVTNNAPVETVYTDKSRNYSGTEFLPVPSKAPNKQFTYEFVGWDKNCVDSRGNTIVRAIYLQRVKTVTVNFYNEDRDTLLRTYNVEVGAGAVPDDLEPTKKETKEFAYEFVGWDKDTMSFYEDTNVYAVFKAVPKKYSYKFLDDDGKTIISEGYAIFGTPISAPVMSAKHVENDKVNEFIGWKNYEDGMTLSKNVEFTAMYKESKVVSSDEEKIDNNLTIKEPEFNVPTRKSSSSFDLDLEENLQLKPKKLINSEPVKHKFDTVVIERNEMKKTLQNEDSKTVKLKVGDNSELARNITVIAPKSSKIVKK